jgi:hypothetical protein
VTCCAVPVRRKEHCLKGPTVKKRQQKGLECDSGIKGRGTRQPLCLRKKRTSSRVFMKTIALEIEKANIWVSDWAAGNE